MCEEEERAVAGKWATERYAVLCACKRRVFDGREGIARLKASIAQEAKDVAVEIIRAAFGHDVDDAAGGSTKLRGERISYYLKLLHGFLTNG